ncbi:hypothetical protein [Brevundimonas sp. NIBR11]|uniref:hypothetical protein n=1 Tax=Brevundimonas sp. NIBR11 TaxID=3015999 RepID=UPI0022F027D4|nr:hypothetical protein [Brevundimonas sp. NIBR11]WGM31458.1 hypothetical protein KKHFBJBL_01705 [Brevundimonas sp. NIBR11]
MGEVGKLIERLESAPRGDFGLDHDVHVALNLSRDRLDGLKRADLPEITTSLDAALSLAERVLPGWNFSMATGVGTDGPPWVQAYPVPFDEDNCCDAEFAETLPLALCAAILRAKEQAS